MNFTKFDTTNVVSARKGTSTIRINRKSSNCISGKAAEIMELAAGDKISLLQSDDKDWYMIKDDDGFELRKNGNGGHGLLFNSTAMAEKILTSAKLPEKSYAFKVASEAQDTDYGPAYCIIIASAK